MRKIYVTLTLLCFGSISFAQSGQLLNRGFENWSNITTFEFPDMWQNSNSNEFRGIPLTTKSTDAQHLTYSVKMENEVIGIDTLIGYVYIGQADGGGLHGVPYGTPFNQVTGYYKCDMFGTDTAYAIIVPFIGGSGSPMLYPFYGTHSTWTAFTIPVVAPTIDSLFIGFCSSNPFDNANFHPSSWFMVDNIVLNNTSGPPPLPLPNPSFETWIPNTYLKADDWSSFNEILQPQGITALTQSSDAYTGTSAAELTTYVVPGFGNDTLQGIISSGIINFYSSMPFTPTPYTAEPTLLSGYYKYASVGGDQGMFMLEFYNAGTVVAGYYLPLPAASSYTYFSQILSLPMTPDSMQLVFASGTNPGSVLKIDELSLSGGTVSLQEMAAQLGLKIYPNPVNDIAVFEWESNSNDLTKITLHDMAGRIVYAINYNSNIGKNRIEVNLSNLSCGTYSYTISNNSTSEKGKLIKK